jgi:hypothetical protein
MSTRSPEAISDISSATPHRNPAPLFPERSRYALSETPEGSTGLHGAILLKPWTPRTGGWHENVLQPVGTFVPAEVTSRWPLQNRLAMEKGGFVHFFESAEQAAAEEANSFGGATARRDPIRARLASEAAADPLAKARAAKARIRAERLATAGDPSGAQPEAASAVS